MFHDQSGSLNPHTALGEEREIGDRRSISASSSIPTRAMISELSFQVVNPMIAMREPRAAGLVTAAQRATYHVNKTTAASP